MCESKSSRVLEAARRVAAYHRILYLLGELLMACPGITRICDAYIRNKSLLEDMESDIIRFMGRICHE